VNPDKKAVPPGASARARLAVRALTEEDLPEAERIFRTAFGTFLGAPDPATFWADRDLVRGRFHAPHAAGFAAHFDGELVGTNFATRWGSVGFFGPLTVRPDLWEHKIGQRLVRAATECLERWGTRHAGLFTFAQSAKHVGLYQKFGFWARSLTAIMAKRAEAGPWRPGWARYTALTEAQRKACIRSCRALTNSVYEGLDVGPEIETVQAQGLGDTLVLRDETAAEPVALAVCHYGPLSEAGADACLVKFAAVRPGPAASRNFNRLLDACVTLAAAVGMPTLVAGVNMARHEAYQEMLDRGFRTELQGVAMHRPNEPGYSREGAYVIDDWR